MITFWQFLSLKVSGFAVIPCLGICVIFLASFIGTKRICLDCGTVRIRYNPRLGLPFSSRIFCLFSSTSSSSIISPQAREKTNFLPSPKSRLMIGSLFLSRCIAS